MEQATTLELAGRLFPAVPVPFSAEGEIHRTAHEAYTNWMASQPIGGVAVWVHTGRGLHLTDERRREVLSIWRGALGKDRAIIAGAGARPAAGPEPKGVIADAVSMAELAAGGGADGLLVYAPVALRDAPDRDRLIVEYHREIARVGLPIVLFFLYEAAGGVTYGPALLDELFALPGVAGIKMATLNSVMTFQDVSRQIADRHPSVTLVTGEDRFLGYSIACGATSALVGMGAACTAMQVELLTSGLEGRYERFWKLNRAVDDLACHTFIAPREGYIQRMLWCLAILEVIPDEAAHDPWGPSLPATERSALEACLNRLRDGGEVLV